MTIERSSDLKISTTCPGEHAHHPKTRVQNAVHHPGEKLGILTELTPSQVETQTETGIINEIESNDC